MSAVPRSHFLGAFFRDSGSPPYGVFVPASTHLTPKPYPTAGAVMTGPNGYCDQVAANGVSISGSYLVDPAKLTHAVNLGVGWVRMSAPQQNDDKSHIFGAGTYDFTDFDSAQCASYVKHGMRPVVGLDTGPVEYNKTSTFSPESASMYRSAADYATWCSSVTKHEQTVFKLGKFSLPGNEVNTNEQLWPGGEAQIAQYSKACYHAIKTANPSATVYGFELNMDGNVNAPAFVKRMVALGCKPGTCYDAIAMHMSLRYPVLNSQAPCYPAKGGDYSVACLTAVQTAAGAKIHLLISESVYPVSSAEPTEEMKAQAVSYDFAMLSHYSSVDGVSYANVDECAFYPTGTWSGGCLIDVDDNVLPAYKTLQSIAATSFQ